MPTMARFMEMVDLLLHGRIPFPGMSDPPSRHLTARAVVDSAGRLVVPAAIRNALGFRDRQEVILALEGTAVRMTTAEAALQSAVAEAQALARRRGSGKGGEVDAFIATRRDDAAKE